MRDKLVCVVRGLPWTLVGVVFVYAVFLLPRIVVVSVFVLCALVFVSWIIGDLIGVYKQ